ncbi:hypothetical protein [Paracoccus ravus]|uniref:hypothetical protein n=1 Tax=Paracoccus ravus TaxID=2447760 RepID=UPI00106EBFEA|nr:hypothetical protein [Paracoccus ravus]
MTRHITDKTQENGPGRLQNFTRQERESGMHPSVAVLHSRPRKETASEGRRIIEFARIERGHRV